jgi:hypothetical protein
VKQWSFLSGKQITRILAWWPTMKLRGPKPTKVVKDKRWAFRASRV